jgi:hypothetical protein
LSLCIDEIVNNVPFNAPRFYIIFTTPGFVVTRDFTLFI